MAKRRKSSRKAKAAIAERPSGVAAARANAAQLIEAGDLARAEAILEKLDPVKNRDAEAVHLLGLIKVRQGRVQEGMSLIDRSILAEPNAGWMRVNRAAVLQGKGEHKAAIEDLEIAVELAPDVSEAWSNLAASRSFVGDYEGAAEAGARAVALNGDSVVALTAHANTLMRVEKFEAAVDVYRKALKCEPNRLTLRVSLLQALEKLGRDDDVRAEVDVIAGMMGAQVAGDGELSESMAAGAELVSGAGEAIEADAVLAIAYESVGAYEKAIEAAERACAKAPNHAYGWAAMGIALNRSGDPDASIAPLRRATALRPNWAEVEGVLANSLWLTEATEEGIEVLERALQTAPKMPSLWASLGAARLEMRDIAGAQAAYAEALSLAPDNGKYALNLALAQIRAKNFRDGFENYERRWNAEGFADQQRPHVHPLWDGSDLTGKKILVYAEQGVGDEIMYAGFIQRLIDQGAAVFLEANARMVELFERSFPGAVVGQSQNPPLPAFASDDFDFQAPGGTLMRHLAPSYDDLTPAGAYLKADPEKVRRFRESYNAPGPDGAPPKLVVGVAWRSGNPTTGRRRSADLAKWGEVLQVPGVRFVNLQYGDVSAEIAAAKEAFGADIVEDKDVDSSGPLDDFAAQVAALDLVVSIDNSTVHFAGALGVPTLMLLNYEPDWRWFGADAGNPWYEAVAHVRQDAPGAWAPVMEAAAGVIAEAADGVPLPIGSNPLHPAMVNRGAQPKALLLNDTTAWYHWGCTATSLAIRDQLSARGYDVAAAPIREIYSARPAPATLQDFDSGAFFHDFAARNPALLRRMATADRIVVNGEGTLHGVSDNVRALLYAIYQAAARLEKPVQVVNHSCYPEDAPTITDAAANGLYRKVYSQLEYVAFREHVSHGLMAKLGIEGALAFDSLPLTARKLRPTLPTTREKRLVIAGSAAADDSTAAAFAEYARWAGGAGWTVVMLGGARCFPAADETNFLRALARHGMPAGTELVMARSLERWMAEIARAGMVATGRFHHSIAAFSLGAPFIAAGSNTAKTHALMQLLERPAPLPVRGDSLEARLVEAHVLALDRQESAADHAARLEAVETLAMENFARL